MAKFSLAPTALGAAVVLVVGVVAVGSVALANPGDCELDYQPGKASSLVTTQPSAEGGVTASFPTPLRTTGRELSVIVPGEGAPAKVGGSLDFDLSAFLGSTGEFIFATSYQPRNPSRRVLDRESDDFISSTLACARPGSTLVATTTIEDLFGPIPGDDLVTNDSTVVVVIDVRNTYASKATGSARLPQSGMPTVVTSPDGVHGVSFPNAPAPTDLRVSVLKQGFGQAIEEGDFVTTHFTGLTWNTQQVFVTSFTGGAPLSLVAIDSSATADGVGVIPGIAQALIGQTIGSQVLVSVPPHLGYPAGQAPSGVPDNATLVYVFDILGTQN